MKEVAGLMGNKYPEMFQDRPVAGKQQIDCPVKEENLSNPSTNLNQAKFKSKSCSAPKY